MSFYKDDFKYFKGDINSYLLIFLYGVCITRLHL